MQPKFTQKKFGTFCARIIVLVLVLAASTQFSVAQKNQAKQPNQVNENTLSLFERNKLNTSNNALPQASKSRVEFKNADNDAGLPNRVPSSINYTEGTCATFTGSLAPGDPIMTRRLNRNGVQGVCPGPKPFAPDLAGNTYYDTHTWTNNTGSAQCVTFTLTTSDATTNIEFGVYSGAFNPANLATNFLTDPGLSSGTPPAATSCSATIPAGQLLTFVVFSPNALQTASNYTLTVDAPVGCGAGPACVWSPATVYPINILDQACVTVGSSLYSFAGVSNNTVIANSYKFDGTVWTAIAPTPQALEYPGACTDGTNIYILGGASTTGTPQTTLYRYNVATNTYTTLAPFSFGAWNPTVVYNSGKIYKFCGTGAAGSLNTLEIYDIATNTWTNGAPYPISVSFVSAIARGGFIYSGGGVATTGTVASSKTYRYDPGTNTWDDAAIADLPATRWGAASSFYNNNFVMAGGYVAGSAAGNNSPTVVGWDQASNTWTALPNMTTACTRMGGEAMGGSFYVIGGRTIASAGFGGSNQNQKLFCTPPTPCTGAPNPGNTVSSTNPVCSGVGFTLSLQNNPFVSGFTYQWQSSSTGLAGSYTDIAGATNATYNATQTARTWYRCIVTCTPSALSTISNPLLVADGQGVFNTHPANTSTQCSGNATFSFTATGASLVYAWEYRVTPASPWLSVTNGGVYSGATTSTLTITGAASTMNGYQYRGLISGPCTAVDFSNVATLTVTPLVATVTPTSATICNGTIQAISLTNPTSPTVVSFASGPLAIQIPDMIGPPASPPAVCDAGISHSIPVALPAGAQVFRMDVRVNITHTYVGDLKLVLKNSTTNQVLNLIYHKSGTGTAGANFINTVISSAGVNPVSSGTAPGYTGLFRADASIGAGSFGDASGSGTTAYQPTTTSWNTLWGGLNQGTGTWTLAINDAQEWAGDIGTLTSWSMDITYGSPATGIWTSNPSTPNTMFTDPAATVAYVSGTPVNTIYVRPAVTTTYSVVYSTVTPPCTSAPTNVTVNVVQPLGTIVQPTNKSVCVGGTTSFSVTAPGGPFNYQWQESRNSGLTWSNISNGGVYSGATTNTLTLTGVTRSAPVDMNNFRYRVNVSTTPCPGSFTSSEATLTVWALPTVTISATDLALLPNQTSTITATSNPAPGAVPNWAWTRDGAPIAGASTGSVVADIDRMGVYQTTVTDINGCRNSSNQLLIEAEAGDKLWIYPNPTSGAFQIRLYYPGVITEKRRIQIFNSAGAEVMSRDIMLSNVSAPHYQRFDVDLGFQPAGVYLVRVIDMYTKKAKSGFVIKQSTK